MKQSQFYYLLRRGLFKSMSVVREGLVMFNKFTTAGISHPAQGSAEFNGSSDSVSIPNIGITGGQARTITAWVYNNGNGTIVNLGSDAIGEKYSFRIILNDLRIEIAGSGYTSNLALTSNKWHHVAITQSGANLNTAVLYLDGSSENSTTSATTNTTESGNNLIGKQITGDPFNGNLANVAIWNRALSSDEINSVMWKSVNALTSAESNGLQAWYSLDDISGASVPDSSGNGNTGTAN